MRQICRAGVLLCGLAAGCVTRGDTEALEAALRGHENQIASLERQLEEAHEELTVARREAAHFRSQAAKSGDVVLASEQSEVLFRAEGLRINTLMTGGLDEDGRPGDEVLSVVLEPFDAEDQTLKLPGDVTIELSDPAAAGDAESIGTWTYAAKDVRKAWHTGLLVTGFRFRLPLSEPPQHETLVLHARLTSTDGRIFDATETVKIHLPGERRPAEPPG